MSTYTPIAVGWVVFQRCLFVALLLLAATAAAQPPDTLTIATGADHSGQQRMTGRVVDFAGNTLTWENVAGSQTTITADRVVDIESKWNDDHRVANQLFASGQYATALELYAKAIAAEPRLWVRRMILAKAVWCCRNTNQQHRAVRTFLALLSSDPLTPYMDCIPLQWSASAPDPALNATALQVMQLEAPAAAQLLGASWLLHSADRARADETLQRLTTYEDKRIALLAETQLWRSRAGAAVADNADRFGTVVQNMPLEFQAGPTLLWADSLTAANRHREAAIAYLRVPVLNPLAGDLAPEAWYRAGRVLEAEGRNDEAVLALQTLLKEHPQSILAGTAATRLEQITKP